MGWNLPKPRGNVISSFRETRAGIYTAPSNRIWTSLSIINESLIFALSFRVNNLTIRILPRGTFDDDFEDFTQVEILNNATHSIVMRG